MSRSGNDNSKITDRSCLTSSNNTAKYCSIYLSRNRSIIASS